MAPPDEPFEYLPKLNPESEALFRAWQAAHNVRETCPLCDSPDYALGARNIAGYGDLWFVHVRTCRNCGHVLLFDVYDRLPSREKVTRSEQDGKLLSAKDIGYTTLGEMLEAARIRA